MDNAEKVFREIVKAKDLDALQIMVSNGEMFASSGFGVVCETADWPEALRWLKETQRVMMFLPEVVDATAENNHLENLKYLHYEAGVQIKEDQVRKILLKSKTPVGEWVLSIQDYSEEFLTECLYDAVTVGNPRLVKALHLAGGNIKDVEFRKAALGSNDLDVIKYLNNQNIELESMIPIAFKRRKWRIIKECLKNPKFDSKKVNWEECLFHALNPNGGSSDTNLAVLNVALEYKPTITVNHLHQAARGASNAPLRRLVEEGASLDDVYSQWTIRRLLEIVPAGSEQAKKLEANLFRSIAYGKRE